MSQRRIHELWYTETRRRTVEAIVLGTIATLLFCFTFHDEFVQQNFIEATAGVLIVLQCIRFYFFKRVVHLSASRWLFWNDVLICGYAGLWSVIAYAISYNDPTSSVALYTTVLLMMAAFVSSAAHFHCSSTWAFAIYWGFLAVPGLILANRLASTPVHKGSLTFLVIVYGFLQAKSRASLWRAISSISGMEVDLKEAVDSFPGGLIHVRERSYFRTNHYARRLLRTDAEGLVGKRVGLLENDRSIAHAMETFLKGKSDFLATEATLSTSDGPREHLLLFKRGETHTDDVLISLLDIHRLAETENELDREREEATKRSAVVIAIAEELERPVEVLAEQVLISSQPDPDTVRASIRSIKVAIQRLHSAA